jgi:hypothetical protein
VDRQYTRDHALQILSALNAINPRIQFEMEEEGQNGCLNYLDVTLINHHTSTISIKWFQKHVTSGRFLNYLSAHHPNTLFNTAKSFVKNMFMVSSPQFHPEIAEKAKQLLILNNYPSRVINRILRDTSNSIEVARSSSEMGSHPLSSSVNSADFYQGFFSLDLSSQSCRSNAFSSQQKRPTSGMASSSKKPKPNNKYTCVPLPYIKGISQELSKEFASMRPDHIVGSTPLNKMKPIFYDQFKKPEKKPSTMKKN